MDTSNPKSILVDTIKKSSNILVTVAHNPSVDALAAALGFSLMLNKLDKHATAVFSGVVPPAITFLEPEKNFQGTVDSLRDFIIAIDKEKADRLRYKVEGDVVRIYITPYRTNISEKDLQYSQGDFNVDLIIALGVEKQSDLDESITAHGRILHDATVATVNTSNIKSSIGTLDWSDDKASSLCEMLMSLSEALQPNLLDEQIATALLTGIVAATDRFSNSHTTPRVMTMSAQLMAAGANQQLIAEKLEQGGESLAIQAPIQTAVEEQPSVPDETASSSDDGAMQVHHDDDVVLPPVATADDGHIDTHARLEQALGHTQPLEHLQHELEEAAHERDEQQHDQAASVPSTDWRDHVHEPVAMATNGQEPLMGGTLNATASEAEETARAEERSSRNHTILSHDAPPATNSPFTTAHGANGDEPDDAGMFAQDGQVDEDALHRNAVALTKGKTLQPVTMSPINAPVTPPALSASAPLPSPQSMFPSTDSSASSAGLQYEETPPSIPEHKNQTLADLEAEVHAAAQAHPATSSIDDARAAVSSAFGTQPLSVGGQPTAPLQVPLPPAPPMPDFSTLPPLPPVPGQTPVGPHPATPLPQLPQTPPSTQAPGQFQIPGAP